MQADMTAFIALLGVVVGVLLIAAAVAVTREIRSSRVLRCTWIDQEFSALEDKADECETGRRIDRSNSLRALSPEYTYLMLRRGELDRVAELIARQYGLRFKKISVRFDHNVPHQSGVGRPAAGVVEMSDTWDGVYADVCVDGRYEGSGEEVAAILAHELSHIWLTTLDIYGESLDQERRTDLAVYLCGMGKLALNAIQRESHLGYLTRQEMAYAYRWVCRKEGIAFAQAMEGLREPAKLLLTGYRRNWEAGIGQGDRRSVSG